VLSDSFSFSLTVLTWIICCFLQGLLCVGLRPAVHIVSTSRLGALPNGSLFLGCVADYLSACIFAFSSFLFDDSSAADPSSFLSACVVASSSSLFDASSAAVPSLIGMIVFRACTVGFGGGKRVAFLI
jgi:hypothetical protein